VAPGLIPENRLPNMALWQREFGLKLVSHIKSDQPSCSLAAGSEQARECLVTVGVAFPQVS
jgi:hypothetical protein